MKIKTVSYAMLRVTRQFENDRVEVVIELDPKDKIDEVFRRAKAECLLALNTKRGCL